MTRRHKFAWMAFMEKQVAPNHIKSCRVGDLFKTKLAAEEAVKATFGWRDGLFDRIQLYRKLVSVLPYKALIQ